MKKLKKPRIPLMIGMSFIVLVALFITCSFFSWSSKDYFEDMAIDESQAGAKIAAAGIEEIIFSSVKNVDEIADKKIRSELEKRFTHICRESELQYIFVYTVDQNEKRHYILFSGSEEGFDEKYWEEYHYGITDDEPLTDAERQALAGDRGGCYEFREELNDNICAWIFPLMDDEGKIEALLEVDYNYRVIKGLFVVLMVRSWVLVGVVVLFSMLIARSLLKRLIFKPVKKLSRNMEHFSKHRSLKYAKRKTITRNEITDIEDSFESMVNDITGYMEHIEKLTADEVQNKTQMDVARKIQQGIVPDKYGIKGSEYDLFGISHPAKEVGGDFYDIFFLDEKRVCAIIGDISGKGVSAALFMMMVKSSIREKIRAGRGVADSLNDTNAYICASNPECMFATVFAFILDLENGKVTYANAGHNPPLILGDEAKELKVDPGLAIGLFDDADIHEQTLFLKKGEGIFLYTDGITEAIDKNQKQFGIDRLIAQMSENTDTVGFPAREKTLTLIEKVLEYQEGLQQFDDMTGLMALYMGKEDTEGGASFEEFSKMKETIMHVITNEDKAKNAVLACEEIYVNIMDYSGADSVNLAWEERDDKLIVRFMDNGKPFDPLKNDGPKHEFEDLDKGGMGINLVKRYTQNISYRRDMGQNILSLTLDT